MVFQNNQFQVTQMALAKATPRRGSDLDGAQVALTCG